MASLALQYLQSTWSMVLSFATPLYIAGAAIIAILCILLRAYTGGFFGYLLRYAVYVGIFWAVVHSHKFSDLFPPSTPIDLRIGLIPASQKLVAAIKDGQYPAYIIGAYLVVGLWVPVTIIGWIFRRRRLARRDRMDFALASAGAIEGGAAGAPSQAFDVVKRESEKKQTMVIMMTDIKGYSARMEKDEAATFALLKEHNVIMRRAIGSNRGREIKTIGDAFMVVFNHPVDAVRCGMAMQKDLHAFNKPRPANDHLLVRIGVHQGEVIVTAKDVFGEGVNIAARMESITEPGGMSISKDIYEAIKGKVEAGFQSIGIPKMKNIANPPEVYRVHIAHQ